MRYFFYLMFLSLYLFARQFEAVVEVEEYDKNIVALGRELFGDPILSKDGTISCLSCHFEYGADVTPRSFGVGGQEGEVNSLSVFNSSLNYFHHWSGDIPSLHEQFDNPVKSSIEMSSDEQIIDKRLNSSSKYKELFLKAYGEKPSYDLAKNAVVAFQETLVTPSRFDEFLLGKEELSQQELRGFKYFKNYGCASCHNGRNLGGNSLQKFGAIIPRVVDGKEEGYFRVASLRNVAKTAPYFHDGSVGDLNESIKLMGYHNLGTHLSTEEIEDIEAFLKTLTGKLPTTWSFE
ncbi:MAG: cytochrome-c peroxidase [Campylobacterales bacterium]